jgi:hypothetical protein
MAKSVLRGAPAASAGARNGGAAPAAELDDRLSAVGAILPGPSMTARAEPSTPTVTATNAELDAILAIQITVAWAGERIGGEGRLGWWRTELTDPDAGGDFLARLLPRTHAWAGLGAVRQAARRIDEAARRTGGTPDAKWSLFHFGFAWDERLDARLAEHRQSDAPPTKALAGHLAIAKRFDRSAFGSWLDGLAREVASEVVPGGRRLRNAPTSKVEGARRLAAALAPVGAEYPLPFFVMGSP